MKTQRSLFCLLFTLAAFCLGGCGLEDFPVLDAIPAEYVSLPAYNIARVRIPSANDASFTHYMVFYRIYVSDTSLAGDVNNSDYSIIHSTLSSNWSTANSYIESETRINEDMDRMFRTTMQYKSLELENNSIETVLAGSSVFGKYIYFFFSSLGSPKMIISNSGELTEAENPANQLFSDTLKRSNDYGEYRLLPANGYFVNTQDLRTGRDNDTNTNLDVLKKTGTLSGPLDYSYAALFIVGVGMNNAAYIYSKPTLIHVFRLPDSF